MEIIQTYLKKRGITDPWIIDPLPQKKFHQVVVIPAYGEAELLPNTLASLNTNDVSILKKSLVLAVVNNAVNSPQSILKNNQTTLKQLKSVQYNFTLGVIDAASPKLELPNKQAGVGLARKIGMDLALSYLSSTESLIFCTDADTVVSNDYIKKVKKYFDTNRAQAAVVGFGHLKSNDSVLNAAILHYENYLKSTAKNMTKSGSPYGYVAMGSTMICTVKAYCAVGGMPRKKATEDFYFLQELTKYCDVNTIPDILVHPSPRPIYRVYLGTGFRMKQVQSGFDIGTLYYSDAAFHLLSKWINLGSNAWKMKLSQLIKQTSTIHPGLTDFLQKEEIENIWTNLQNNTPSEFHFSKQFHRWFDGLKTIRFLKHFT